MWGNRLSDNVVTTYLYTSLLINKKEPPRLVNQEGSYNNCLLDY